MKDHPNNHQIEFKQIRQKLKSNIVQQDNKKQEQYTNFQQQIQDRQKSLQMLTKQKGKGQIKYIK